MIDDTISRQAAIDALMTILDKPNHAEFLYTDEICKVLNELPSAERKGHWENYLKNGLRYKCSVCGSRYNLAWNYCPNCGARMERE